MATLSEQQIDKIFDLIVDNGVSYESLQVDLLDHVCCMVEQKMDEGKSFGDSLKLALQEFGYKHFSEIQEATIYLLTLKQRKMKKTTGIIGIISSLLVISGVFFKIMHWPGAGILLVIGLVLIGVIVFPLMATLDINNASGNMKKLTASIGYFAAVLLSIATLFKIMHWPGATITYYSGLSLLVFVFIPLFTIKNYKTAENKIMAIAKSTLILAGVVIFWGLMPTGDVSHLEKTHKPYHQHVSK